MKLLTLLIFFGLSSLALTDTRTWTNLDGKTIIAELVKVDAQEVILNKNGKEYRIPINTLSEEDQTHISEWQAPGEDATEEIKENASGLKFPLKLNNHVSGPDIPSEISPATPIVIHQWQAYCQRCPASLDDFEKFARRNRKSGALFMIWHSHNKIEMAKSKSENLDLDLPIYHGSLIRWDKQFGENVWPQVIIMQPNGEIVYMGAPDREFKKKLKEVTENE